MLLRSLAICLLIHFALPLQGQKKVSVAFTINEKDLIPEGIAYDVFDKSFYLGSIHKHKVVRISSKGVVSDFIKSDQDGVGKVLGMKVDPNRHLWFCSNPPKGSNGYSTVFEYEISTGKLVNKYELAIEGEKHELNDLQFLNGSVYVTDSSFGAIYKIADGKIDLFLKSDQLQYSNGITSTIDESKLLVSTVNGITSVDPTSKETKTLECPFYIVGVDGLYRYNNSLIAIQNVTFPTSVVQFHLSEDSKNIVNATLLAVNHPQFDIPTTGVVVGDWFYLIANSQLLQIMGSNGKIKNPEKLKDVVILKIPLK
jgi:hypothetical protein